MSSCAHILSAFIYPRGKEPYMSADEIREVGRRFVEEVINEQNLAAADELVAENFVELTS